MFDPPPPYPERPPSPPPPSYTCIFGDTCSNKRYEITPTISQETNLIISRPRADLSADTSLPFPEIPEDNSWKVNTGGFRVFLSSLIILYLAMCHIISLMPSPPLPFVGMVFVFYAVCMAEGVREMLLHAHKLCRYPLHVLILLCYFILAGYCILFIIHGEESNPYDYYPRLGKHTLIIITASLLFLGAISWKSCSSSRNG